MRVGGAAAGPQEGRGGFAADAAFGWGGEVDAHHATGAREGGADGLGGFHARGRVREGKGRLVRWELSWVSVWVGRAHEWGGQWRLLFEAGCLEVGSYSEQ